MDQIKDVVKKVLRRCAQQKEECGAGDIEEEIKKILTKDEQKHIKFNYFRKGILGLGADCSSWLYHASLQRERWLAQLREKREGLEDIRLRLE